MLGNWSVPRSQLAADTVPDFCAGFLYAVTPQLGARLVRAAAAVFGELEEEVVLIEDSLITGLLRQRLGDVGLGSLALGPVWTSLLSHCPWLTVARTTFLDPLVVRKTSDRSGVQYVGSLTEPGVWRFFLCLHVETALGAVEGLLGATLPDFVWDVCQR